MVVDPSMQYYNEEAINKKIITEIILEVRKENEVKGQVIKWLRGID